MITNSSLYDTDFSVHRLVELAEFYQLGNYQEWSRMHHAADVWAGDSDSSDSSDGSSNITRAEAVRAFPEAAHQALAATLGLIYYKIRNEVGEGPYAAPTPRPPKRQQEDGASASSGKKTKPVKMPRRPSVSDNTFLHQLITGPSIESKTSVASEEYDKLGWKAFPDVSVSDEAINHKLRSIDPQDIGTVLRALEQGRLKLKPSRSEKLNMSPTETTASKAAQGVRVSAGEHADEVATVPNTVLTQAGTSSSQGQRPQGSVSGIPANGSDSDSSSS